ncbi:MAG: GNAT family N-acetyltransferase [Gammaproteobacteria bacterium]|nr:GNAT family N-acetyltransferase [Gammaproteobacteria bacterium]
MTADKAAATPLAPETTTYLEMLSPADLKPSRANPSALTTRRLPAAEFAVGRRMYQEVGRDFLWIDRLQWPDRQWREYYERPGIELWIGEATDGIAGYFELDTREDGSTELAYFGLAPGFIGRGLGGLLLTAAIRQAWANGARRVWVHTSSRDHSGALPNYLARGLRIYHTETKPAPAQPG